MSTAATTDPTPSSAKMLTLTIDGVSVSVPEKTTVIDAARKAGIIIPALCHKEDLTPVGVCRVCTVSCKGDRVYAASCMRECREGMVVETGCDHPHGIRQAGQDVQGADTTAGAATPSSEKERVAQARRTLVEMLLAEHPVPCKRHQESHDCELELLGERLGLLKPYVKPKIPLGPSPKTNGRAKKNDLPIISPPPAFASPFTPRAYSKGTDFSNPSIAIDHSACILCDRCVRACTDVAHNEVIGRMGKGNLTSISFDDNKPMGDSSCVNCGWCMISCPTGAITYNAGVQPKMSGAPLTVVEMKEMELFQGVSSEFLKRSEGGIVVRQFAKGEMICRQGEFGSTAFFIDSGSVDIYIDNDFSHVRTKKSGGGLFTRMASLLVSRTDDKRREEGGKQYIPIDASVDLSYEKPIARVGQGELIGEAACMNYQPRSATMRAAEDTIVYEMLRNVLDILRRNRKFKAEMERKYRERALSNHLRSVPVFADLPDDFINELRDKVQLLSFGPGEDITRQGDKADAFYLVRMGHVKVYQQYGDGKGMVLSYLSRSQFFGEIGLLSELTDGAAAGSGRRNATCTALDHVELVRIGKAEFDDMMQRFPHIRQRLQTVADQRLAMDHDYQRNVKRVSLQQYIDQGLFQAQSLLVLDLEKCTRCDECVRACAEAHDGITRLIRDGLRYDKYLVTTSCRSCRDPYCMVGCPVGSIRRKDDMQIIIEDHCIGCGRCAEQCPYGNINMHPFEMKITDFATGKTHKEERRKATVCDLCTDICINEYDEPACVYACPHDAAHRVDGQTLFDMQSDAISLNGGDIDGTPAPGNDADKTVSQPRAPVAPVDRGARDAAAVESVGNAE